MLPHDIMAPFLSGLVWFFTKLFGLYQFLFAVIISLIFVYEIDLLRGVSQRDRERRHRAHQDNTDANETFILNFLRKIADHAASYFQLAFVLEVCGILILGLEPGTFADSNLSIVAPLSAPLFFIASNYRLLLAGYFLHRFPAVVGLEGYSTCFDIEHH